MQHGGLHLARTPHRAMLRGCSPGGGSGTSRARGGGVRRGPGRRKRSCRRRPYLGGSKAQLRVMLQRPLPVEARLVAYNAGDVGDVLVPVTLFDETGLQLFDEGGDGHGDAQVAGGGQRYAEVLAVQPGAESQWELAAKHVGGAVLQHPRSSSAAAKGTQYCLSVDACSLRQGHAFGYRGVSASQYHLVDGLGDLTRSDVTDVRDGLAQYVEGGTRSRQYPGVAAHHYRQRPVGCALAAS